MVPPPRPLRQYATGAPMGMHPVTEDTPADMLEGPMDLRVTLPTGKTITMDVERSTPMMDLLVQVTTAHRINPGNHVIRVLSDNRHTVYKPSTPIGNLDTTAIQIVPKNTVNGTDERNNRQQIMHDQNVRLKPKEWVYRIQLLVNLPQNQLAVYRIPPKTLISDILKMVCEDKNLDIENHEIRHPQNIDERLRGSCSLSDYQLQEVCIVNRDFRPPPLSVTDLITMASIAHQNEGKRRGFRAFFSRKNKSSTGDSSISSGSAGDRSISPARSDESTDHPISNSSKAASDDSKVKMRKHERRIPRPSSLLNLAKGKKRPAPRPPSENRISKNIEEESSRSHNGDASNDMILESKSNGKSNLTTVLSKSTPSLTPVKSKRKAPPPPPVAVEPDEIITDVIVEESPVSRKTSSSRSDSEIKDDLITPERHPDNVELPDSDHKDSIEKSPTDIPLASSESSESRHSTPEPRIDSPLLSDVSSLSEKYPSSTTTPEKSGTVEPVITNPPSTNLTETRLLAATTEATDPPLNNPASSHSQPDLVIDLKICNVSSDRLNHCVDINSSAPTIRIISKETDQPLKSILKKKKNPSCDEDWKVHKSKLVDEYVSSDDSNSDKEINDPSATSPTEKQEGSMQLKMISSFKSKCSSEDKPLASANSNNSLPATSKQVTEVLLHNTPPEPRKRTNCIPLSDINSSQCCSDSVPEVTCKHQNVSRCSTEDTNSLTTKSKIEASENGLGTSLLSPISTFTDFTDEKAVTYSQEISTFSEPAGTTAQTIEDDVSSSSKEWSEDRSVSGASDHNDIEDSLEEDSNEKSTICEAINVDMNLAPSKNDYTESKQNVIDQITNEVIEASKRNNALPESSDILKSSSHVEKAEWADIPSSNYNVVLSVTPDSISKKRAESNSTSASYQSVANRSFSGSPDVISSSRSGTESSYESAPPPLPDTPMPEPDNEDNRSVFSNISINSDSRTLSRQSSISDLSSKGEEKARVPGFSISTYKNRSQEVSYDKKIIRAESCQDISRPQQIEELENRRNNIQMNSTAITPLQSRSLERSHSGYYNKVEEIKAKIEENSDDIPRRPWSSMDTWRNKVDKPQVPPKKFKEYQKYSCTGERPKSLYAVSDSFKLRKAQSTADMRVSDVKPDKDLDNEYMKLQDDFLKWQQQLLQNQNVLHNRVVPIAANPPTLSSTGGQRGLKLGWKPPAPLMRNMMQMQMPNQMQPNQQEPPKPREINIPIRFEDDDNDVAPAPRNNVQINQRSQPPRTSQTSGNTWDSSRMPWEDRPSNVECVIVNEPPQVFEAPNDPAFMPIFFKQRTMPSQTTQSTYGAQPQTYSMPPNMNSGYGMNQAQFQQSPYQQQYQQVPQFQEYRQPASSQFQDNFQEQPNQQYQHSYQPATSQGQQPQNVYDARNPPQNSNYQAAQPRYGSEQGLYNNGPTNSGDDLNNRFKSVVTLSSDQPSQMNNARSDALQSRPKGYQPAEPSKPFHSKIISNAIKSQTAPSNQPPSAAPMSSKLVQAVNQPSTQSFQTPNQTAPAVNRQYQANNLPSPTPNQTYQPVSLPSQPLNQSYQPVKQPPQPVSQPFQETNLQQFEQAPVTPPRREKKKSPSPVAKEPSPPFANVALRSVDQRISPPKSVKPAPYYDPPPQTKAIKPEPYYEAQAPPSPPGPPAPPAPPTAPAPPPMPSNLQDRRTSTGKKIISSDKAPELDAREELMMQIRKFGGSGSLKKTGIRDLEQ